MDEPFSRAVVKFGRHADSRPPGLLVSENGTMRLRDVMKCWGFQKRLTEMEVLRAVQSFLFHEDTSLRYKVDEDFDGKTTILVTKSHKATREAEAAKLAPPVEKSTDVEKCGPRPTTHPTALLRPKGSAHGVPMWPPARLISRLPLQQLAITVDSDSDDPPGFWSEDELKSEELTFI